MKSIDALVEKWAGGTGQQCRLLVEMQRLPQDELNVDVLDHDATKKLEQWFNDRWTDKWCIDITQDLIQVIDESWARPECPPPYQIYVKMAYHLAEEARAGLSEFTIPADIRGVLLEFQSAAVRIAARHLGKRGGVILGDVAGFILNYDIKYRLGRSAEEDGE